MRQPFRQAQAAGLGFVAEGLQVGSFQLGEKIIYLFQRQNVIVGGVNIAQHRVEKSLDFLDGKDLLELAQHKEQQNMVAVVFFLLAAG